MLSCDDNRIEEKRIEGIGDLDRCDLLVAQNRMVSE